MTTTTQAPIPDGETAQPANGLTDGQAQAHPTREPEAVREPGPAPAGEPDPDPGEQPQKIPALAIPDLRPYADPKAAAGLALRGIKASREPAASIIRRAFDGLAGLTRRALAALCLVIRLTLSGSRTLLGLLAGWLTGTYGTKGSTLTRAGAVLGVLLATAHTVAQYPTQTSICIAGLWCQAAIMAARGLFDRLLGNAGSTKKKGARKTPPQNAEGASSREPAPARRKGIGAWLRKTSPQAPAEPPAKGTEPAPAEPPLTALIRELIGTDNGVHLSTLRPAMRERLPGLARATDQQLRKVLLDAGFDPSRTFRARGVAGRAGVHHSQLPPLPSPSSGQGAAQTGSPPSESGTDLRKSSDSPRTESRAESGRTKRRKLPEGWTDEDDARGYRWVNDATRGPSAWVIQLRKDAD